MKFEFRPLTESDIPLLHEWLCKPHLKRWWRAETSLEDVRNKYLPRIAGVDAATPYLAYLGDEPVGYIQSYNVTDGTPNWWPDEPGNGVMGIDQFIADGERLGQGLGTAMVSQFVAFLMLDPHITEIRVDPRPDNERAVRCYTKVGFREAGPITTPDGPAIMMVLSRSTANPSKPNKTINQ